MTAALDVEKFAKVQALARAGATAGERHAAQSRLNAMAKAAGMTVEDAIRRCASASKPDPAAEAARRSWEQMRTNPISVKRRSRLVDLYGSEERAKGAIFADTPREAALRAAVEPFRVQRETTGWRIGSLMGWGGGSASSLAASIIDAIKSAWPMPATVRGGLREYQEWRDLGDDRASIEPWYDDADFVRARIALLEVVLDKLPAGSLDDMMARLDWMGIVHDNDIYRDVSEDAAWLATLRADVIRLNEGARSGERYPVHSEHLTASGRRALVLSMLDSPETSGLPDREIARRVGVSPTTVGKLRRAAR